jgi:hypothetical protein
LTKDRVEERSVKGRRGTSTYRAFYNVDHFRTTSTAPSIASLKVEGR